MKTYAAYKGENFIMIGTIKEIASELGVTQKQARWYASKINIQRDCGNRTILVKVDDDE